MKAGHPGCKTCVYGLAAPPSPPTSPFSWTDVASCSSSWTPSSSKSSRLHWNNLLPSSSSSSWCDALPSTNGSFHEDSPSVPTHLRVLVFDLNPTVVTYEVEFMKLGSARREMNKPRRGAKVTNFHARDATAHFPLSEAVQMAAALHREMLLGPCGCSFELTENMFACRECRTFTSLPRVVAPLPPSTLPSCLKGSAAARRLLVDDNCLSPPVPVPPFKKKKKKKKSGTSLPSSSSSPSSSSLSSSSSSSSSSIK